MSERRRCCALVERVDIDVIDAALRAIGTDGAETLNAIHHRLEIAKSMLSRHRAHLAEDGAPTGGAVVVPLRQEQRRNATGTSGEHEERREAAEPDRPTLTLVLTTRETFADRVAKVATLVEQDRWHGYPTATGLAGHWGVDVADVLRVHKVAAVKVKQARGGGRGELEASLASFKGMRDAEKTAADEHDEMARQLRTGEIRERRNAAGKADVRGKWTCIGMLDEDAVDRYAAATWAKAASTARAGALKAEVEIAKILGLLRERVTISLGVTDDAAWEVVYAVQRAILDARYPGASLALEEGMTAFEDGGQEALDAWLREAEADATALVVDGSTVEEAPR